MKANPDRLAFLLGPRPFSPIKLFDLLLEKNVVYSAA
jgi:hypothetical protein